MSTPRGTRGTHFELTEKKIARKSVLTYFSMLLLASADDDDAVHCQVSPPLLKSKCVLQKKKREKAETAAVSCSKEKTSACKKSEKEW